LFFEGRVLEALGHWRGGLEVDPNNLVLLNQTARVLATFPDASVRNGNEAVQLAERALSASGGRDPSILDTLAAAYARVGRYPKAVETARRALDLATHGNDPELTAALQARIALYEAGKPFEDQ